MGSEVAVVAGTIVIGLAIGWIMARLWRAEESVLADLVLGAVGGVVLGWLARRTSVTAEGFLEAGAGAVIGAAGLVTLYRALNKV